MDNVMELIRVEQRLLQLEQTEVKGMSLEDQFKLIEEVTELTAQSNKLMKLLNQ